MARSLSPDTCERALSAALAGENCRSVATPFAVSPASVIRWVDWQREIGSVAARPMGGLCRAVLAGERECLQVGIREKPGPRMAVLAAELSERGVVVEISVVWRFFRAEEISFGEACDPAGPAQRPAGATADASVRGCLIPPDWSSSTMPGPRRTCCTPVAAAPSTAASLTRLHTVTGRR